MIIKVGSFAKRGVLGSDAYLRLLDHVERNVGEAGSRVTIDLIPVTWFSHLSLIALAMVIDRLRAENIPVIELDLPRSPTASGFLFRWGLVTYAESRGCAVNVTQPPIHYQRAALSSVLPLQSFGNDLAAVTAVGAMLRTEDALKALLGRAGFAEYDVSALADLIVEELCKNVAEHGRSPFPSFAVGHVADKGSEKATRRSDAAAPWEQHFARDIAGEGVTEIVVADSGIGIVASLRAAAERTPDAPKTSAKIAEWAFDDHSTSKRDLNLHTRGLSTVREKVRQLRGLLYMRTSYPELDRKGHRGVQLFWDFLRDPAQEHPVLIEDKLHVKGTQFQILLPRRGLGTHKTYIASNLSVPAGETLYSREVELRDPKDIRPLTMAANSAKSNHVLFVHVVHGVRWSRAAVDGLAAELSRILMYGRTRRLWLLNPTMELNQQLGTSVPIRKLWSDHGVVVPIVQLPGPPAPARWELLLSDESKRRKGMAGDTEAARLQLVHLITNVLNDERAHTETLSQLSNPERHWVEDALSRNSSVVRRMPHMELLRLAPPFDPIELAKEAGQALLPASLDAIVTANLASQRNHKERVWYRLPSGLYCKTYVSPLVLNSLSAYDGSRVEQWIEREIRAARPGIAISFSIFAGELLRRALAAVPSAHAVFLDHYGDIHGERHMRELDGLRPGERAVFLVGISGSGRTLRTVAEKLAAAKVDLHILCIVDTMSEGDFRAAPILDRMKRDLKFRALVTSPIEKFSADEYRKRASESERAWPVVHVDPETFLPIPTAITSDKLLSDGRFWRFVAESEALSRNRIIYRGLEMPSYIWLRELLHHPELRQRIIDAIGELASKPEVVLAMPDVVEASKRTNLEGELKARYRYVSDWNFDETEFEGRRVAILCGAASSGSALAKALQLVMLAKSVDVFIVLNRMPVEIASAFVKHERVRLHTFQWLSLASPGSPARHGRSEALRQLNEYRRSALTNRLVVFIDERKDALLRADAYVDSHDEHDFYDPVKAPGQRLFRDDASYDLATLAGRDFMRELVATATDADAEWVRVLLLESAARHDARQVDAALDEHHKIVAELLDAAGKDDDGTLVVKSIIDAMLLERSVGTRSAASGNLSEQAARLANDLWKRFVTLQGKKHPELSSSCIRAIGKVNVRLLLENLWLAVKVASDHRETELTLSLELTKNSALRPFDEELRTALAVTVQGTKDSATSEEQVALRHLLADIGYEATSSGIVPIKWSGRFGELEMELPDADRGIRALVRSVHDLLPDAIINYFRAVEPSGFVLADVWPPDRDRGTKLNSASSLDLVSGGHKGKVFFCDSVITAAPNTPELVPMADALSVMKTDMSLLLIRLDRVGAQSDHLLGILSVQRGFRGGERMVSRELRRDLVELTAVAAPIVDRARFASTIKMAEWARQQSLAEGPSGEGVLQKFLDDFRKLLGADLGRLVIREGYMWKSKFVSPKDAMLAAPAVQFAANDETYMTVKAVRSNRAQIAIDVQEETAHPPAPWLHGAVCIPLMHDGSECQAAVTLWHHTRGWFAEADRALLSLIGRVGGTLFALTLLPARINEAKREEASKVAQYHARRILNHTYAAKAALHQLQSLPAKYRAAVDRLREALRDVDHVVADYQNYEHPRSLSKQDHSLTEVLRSTAEALLPTKPTVIFRENGDVRADVDAALLREVVTELVKWSGSIDDRVPVYLTVHGGNGECVIVVESEAFAAATRELPESLTARKSIELHGGRLERAGGTFQMILPSRTSEGHS